MVRAGGTSTTGSVAVTDGRVTSGGEIDVAILAQIDELLDTYWAGWDAGDGDAVVALMTTGGRFCTRNTPQAGYVGEALAEYVDNYGHLGMTRVGPTIVVGTSAGYEVAGADRVDGFTSAPLWALDHFVIVEQDGRLRIAATGSSPRTDATPESVLLGSTRLRPISRHEPVTSQPTFGPTTRWSTGARSDEGGAVRRGCLMRRTCGSGWWTAWRSGLLVLLVAAGSLVMPAGGGRASAETPGPYGEFTPLAPARILDTRTGVGRDGVVAPLGENAPIEVQVTGRGGVAAAGVAAVVMNVTVTRPTARSFLTVWPSGVERPQSSNLNYVERQTIPNHVTVAVGDGGRVSVVNRFGTAHVIFDVVGFYADDRGSAGSRYHPVDPVRLFDTRNGAGSVPMAPVGEGGALAFTVMGEGGVPSTGVTAVVMNVTVARATEKSFLTVYPGDLAAPPNASNLNYRPGQAVPNLVTVRVPSNGVVKFHNEFGSVHVIADVVGYFDDDRSTQAGRFIPLDPYRSFDSREIDEKLGRDAIWVIGTFPGFAGIPLGEASAVALNVTVTGTTARSYLSVFPSHLCSLPNVSNLNYDARQAVPNQVITRLATDGGCAAPDEVETIAVYNNDGETHIVIDMFGFYTSPTSGFRPEQVTLSPVVWGIELHSHGPGVHTVSMIADAEPLDADDLWYFGGYLSWPETAVELCNVGVRGGGEGFVTVGDVFQTTECGDALQDAFDDYGLPDTACLLVQAWGRISQYCARLEPAP